MSLFLKTEELPNTNAQADNMTEWKMVSHLKAK